MDNSLSIVTPSPLGPIWLAATERGLCALEFGATLNHLAGHLKRHAIAPPAPGETPRLQEAAAQLAAYFDRRLRAFDLPLDLRGTPFQRAVWDELLHISYGQNLTYGEIALEVASPNAAQAVGRAVGANPVSIIVPCHRVLGHNGDLTGYAFGLDRKSALLQLEQNGLQLRMASGELGVAS